MKSLRLVLSRRVPFTKSPITRRSYIAIWTLEFSQLTHERTLAPPGEISSAPLYSVVAKKWRYSASEQRTPSWRSCSSSRRNSAPPSPPLAPTLRYTLSAVFASSCRPPVPPSSTRGVGESYNYSGGGVAPSPMLDARIGSESSFFGLICLWRQE